MVIKRTSKTILNIFWPNFNNSFHPYLLRTPALATATISLALLLVVSSFDTAFNLGTNQNPDITSQNITKHINNHRSVAGVSPLILNDKLSQAAHDKALHMLEEEYFGHYAPSGTTPGDFIKQSGYQYQYMGENLAEGFHTTRGVITGWLSSPQHKDNLLNDKYSHIGVASITRPVYGKDETLVVALYANPAGSVAQQVPSAMSLPPATTYSVLKPLNPFATLTGVALVGGIISTMLAILYGVQHYKTRRHLLFATHIQPKPLLWTILLLGVVAVIISSSYGVVS